MCVCMCVVGRVLRSAVTTGVGVGSVCFGRDPKKDCQQNFVRKRLLFAFLSPFASLSLLACGVIFECGAVSFEFYFR